MTKRKKPIRRRSLKRIQLDRIYEDRRKWFLTDAGNGGCPVAASGLIADYFGEKRPHFRKAVQIHHRRGRVGPLYLDETYWLGVSAEGHQFIHMHPSISYEKGWMLPR